MASWIAGWQEDLDGLTGGIWVGGFGWVGWTSGQVDLGG